MEYGGLDGFIDDLFVISSCRRRGLGRLAIRTLIDECRQRGVLALHVEVGRDNGAANALYAEFGLHPPTDDRQMLTAVLDADAAQ
jgi:GNAT superfamily N-acetyltransferase